MTDSEMSMEDFEMIQREAQEQQPALLRKRSSSLADFEGQKLLEEQEATQFSLKPEKKIASSEAKKQGSETEASTVKQSVDSSKSSQSEREVEVKDEYEEKPVESITQRPSLVGSAKWYQKVWFSWAFPIIKKAGEKKLKIEELGGLREADLIENKL